MERISRGKSIRLTKLIIWHWRNSLIWKMDGIVPSLSEGGSVTTVCEAAARWIAEGRSLDVQIPSDPNLLQQMAKSERFTEVRLSGYVNVIDPGAK